MSCKCKNIIENFQGGTVPLNTTFLQNVDVLGNILSGGTNLLIFFPLPLHQVPQEERLHLQWRGIMVHLLP